MVLLFPNWDVTYLLRGLIGKHAMLGSGLWGGGLMVSVWSSLGVNSPNTPQVEQGDVREVVFGFLARMLDLGVPAWLNW